MFNTLRSRFKSGSPEAAIWDGSADDVLALHGPDGRFRKVSKGAGQLFGVVAADLEGRRLMDVVAPDHQQNLLHALGEISRDGGPQSTRFEFRARAADAMGAPLEMVISRTPAGFRSVTRDIGHRLRKERDIRLESRDRIDMADRRSDQLANFSHELRTPLNAVIGFAGAIHGEQFGPLPNERYRDYARIIHDSSEHLLSLISDILDLNKVEANGTALQLGAEDLPSLIGFCADLLRLRIEEAGLSLEVEIDPGIGRVMIDAKIVRQIVLNLLSNALKFTEDGSIAVSAGIVDDRLEIAVRDTGVGMSPDDLARVGTRFHQARKEGVRGARGSGIGLSLSKALARVHGGELDLSSEAGCGTTAVLRLPWRPVERPSQPVHPVTDNVVPLAAVRA